MSLLFIASRVATSSGSATTTRWNGLLHRQIPDPVRFEIVEAEPNRRIVEKGVGAGGKRRTQGTYLLEEQPERGTRISFELAWLEAPRAERLAPPLIRAFARRSNGRAMRRLAKQLAQG